MTTLSSLCFLWITLVSLLLPLVSAVPVQLYGINYNTRKGPDWEPASTKCKTYLEVTTDLMILSRLTNRIRILSLYDCGQGLQVLEIAKSLGLQVWLGMWVSFDDDIFYQQEMPLLQDIIQRGLIDDTVLGISVGSEAIYREDVTVDVNIEKKNAAEQLLVDNGLGDVPVSICDIAPTYNYKAAVLPNVDVALVNSFPFWEAVPIDFATDYLLEEMLPIYNRAANLGKDVIMGETGWPSDGYIDGVGTASPELQTQFFVDFYCRMDRELGWSYYYFTGIDNKWRQEQDENNTIEGNWGFMYANLQLKPWFQELKFTCPNDPSTEYTFSELDWTLPTVTAPPTISPAPTPPLPEEACLAHAGCVEVNLLSGNCCPTDGPDGIVLGCCGELAGGGETPPPTMADSSATTTAAPMATPTMATATTSEPPVMTDPPTAAPSQEDVTTPEPTPAQGDTPPPTPVPTASGGDETVESPIAPIAPTVMSPQPTTLEPTPSTTTREPTSPSLEFVTFDTSSATTISTCALLLSSMVLCTLLSVFV